MSRMLKPQAPRDVPTLKTLPIELRLKIFEYAIGPIELLRPPEVSHQVYHSIYCRNRVILEGDPAFSPRDHHPNPYEGCYIPYYKLKPHADAERHDQDRLDDARAAVSLLEVFPAETGRLLRREPSLRNATIDVLQIPTSLLSFKWVTWLSFPAVFGLVYDVFRINIRVMSANVENLSDFAAPAAVDRAFTPLPGFINHIFSLGRRIPWFSDMGGKIGQSSIIRRVVVDVIPQADEDIISRPTELCPVCMTWTRWETIQRGDNTDGGGGGINDETSKERAREELERRKKHEEAASKAADDFTQGMERFLKDSEASKVLVGKVGRIDLRHRGSLVKSWDLSSTKTEYEHFGEAWRIFEEARELDVDSFEDMERAKAVLDMRRRELENLRDWVKRQEATRPDGDEATRPDEDLDDRAV